MIDLDVLAVVRVATYAGATVAEELFIQQVAVKLCANVG